MGKFLYTIVCRYYTINGIIEIDMYEVFKRLRLEPFEDDSYGDIRYTWRVYDLIRYHVYTGQAVEYVIKKVYVILILIIKQDSFIHTIRRIH